MACYVVGTRDRPAPLRVARALTLSVNAIWIVGCHAAIATSATDDAGSGPRVDAASCLIVASNYDRSCTQNSDCIAYIYGDGSDAGRQLSGLPANWGVLPVQFGDYCADATPCVCGRDAINRKAVAQYISDVGKTPLILGYAWDNACECGVVVLTDGGGAGNQACCIAGMCTTMSCPAP
jgi:hypothetical protein